MKTRWQQALEDLADGYGFLPPPPPDGGFLVLNKAQISDWDLVCLIRYVYPNTKIIAMQDLPTTGGSVWVRTPMKKEGM